MPTANTDLRRGSRRDSLAVLSSPVLPPPFSGTQIIIAHPGAGYVGQYTSAVGVGDNGILRGLNGYLYTLSTDIGDYFNTAADDYSVGYKDVSGNNVGLAIQYSNFAGYGYGWGGGTYDELFTQYIYKVGTPADINFSGLVAGTYDFVFWGIGPNYTSLPHFSSFTMTGQTKNTIYNSYTPGVYVENEDHVIFRDVSVAASSSITTVTVALGAGASYGPVNAIQIIRKT